MLPINAQLERLQAPVIITDEDNPISASLLDNKYDVSIIRIRDREPRTPLHNLPYVKYGSPDNKDKSESVNICHSNLHVMPPSLSQLSIPVEDEDAEYMRNSPTLNTDLSEKIRIPRRENARVVPPSLPELSRSFSF